MAERNTILVTGATGTIGRPLTTRLAADPSLRVRALVRDPEKAGTIGNAELVRGDFGDAASLASAMKGIDTLVLVTAAGAHAFEQAHAAITAAREAGVRKLVRLSAIKADPEGPTDNTRQHGRTEAEIRASGLTYVFLRPAAFFQNLLWSAQTVLGQGQLYQGTGAAKVGFIDTRDVVDALFAAATSDRFDGQALELTGPRSIDYHEVAAALGRALGRTITYVPGPSRSATRCAAWGRIRGPCSSSATTRAPTRAAGATPSPTRCRSSRVIPHATSMRSCARSSCPRPRRADHPVVMNVASIVAPSVSSRRAAPRAIGLPWRRRHTMKSRGAPSRDGARPRCTRSRWHPVRIPNPRRSSPIIVAIPSACSPIPRPILGSAPTCSSPPRRGSRVALRRSSTSTRSSRRCCTDRPQCRDRGTGVERPTNGGMLGAMITAQTESSGAFRQVVSIDAHTLHADVSVELGGQASAPGPHDYFDGALATCKALTACVVAKQRGFALERVKVEVARDDSKERTGTYRLTVRLTFEGGLSQDEKEKLHAMVARCPIHKLMTTSTVEIDQLPLAPA